MDRIDVVSSSLASVGYNRMGRVLEIEFTSGSIYRYFDVPEEVFQGLLSASSHGTFFHRHIRGYYSYRREWP